MSDVVGSASIRIEPELAPNFQQRLGADIKRALQNIEAQQTSAARQATHFGNAQANAFRQASTGAKGLLSNVNQLRVAYATVASVVAGRFLQSIIASRAEFERSQVAFRAILNESKAVASGFETTSQAVTGLTADIRNLAIRTGASFGDLARGSQALISTLGLSREASVVLLNDIAAAAAASGAALDSIPRAVRAITQISSKGFLSAEELNQIADVLPTLARPKIFEELAVALGKPIEEIQKLAAEGGRITSAQGLPAIVKVLRGVAGASTALDAQLATLSGAMNVLRGTAQAAVQEGFDGLSGAIQGLLENLGGAGGAEAGIIRLQQIFEDLLEPVDRVASALVGSFGKSLEDLLPDLITLADATADIVISFVEMGEHVPNVLDTIGPPLARFAKDLAAVVGFVADAKNAVSGLADTIGNKLNSALVKIPGIGGIFEKDKEKIDKVKKSVGGLVDLLAELAPTATQAAADAQREYGEALKESTPQIEGVISAEGKRIDALEAIADALKTVKDAEQDLADLRSDRVLLVAEQLTELDEARAEALENIVDLTEDLADAEQAVADARQGVVDAEQAVTDARQGVLDADIAVTDSERSLADAREDLLEATQPATERELAAARRDILSAELALEAATRKRVEAEQALAALERRKLNQGKRLAVLGLDNLRTSLANARASAAAVRTVPDEAELREDLRSAIINEAEAAESLVESKEDLLELEQQGLDITDDVIEAREAVEKAERAVESAVRARAAAERDVDAAIRGHAAAERDIAKALGEQTGALTALTAAQNIDLALAPLVKSQKEDLARLDGQIADAVERQKTASEKVKKAREDERIATQELNTELAILAGLANAEFNGLVDKIELYKELGRIGPGAYRAIQAELGALGVKAAVGSTPALTSGGFFGDIGAAITGATKFMAESLEIFQGPSGELLLRPKAFINNILGNLFKFEQGGIITKPTIAMMGERGLKEVVLPLTKPARAFQLAQQSGFLDMLSKHQQPFFPSALQMAKSSPTTIRTQRSGPSGSVGVHDPEVVAQLRALNEKLNKANLGETIDIDITGVGTVDDKLKMRQLSRQVEKAVRRGRHGR